MPVLGTGAAVRVPVTSVRTESAALGLRELVAYLGLQPEGVDIIVEYGLVAAGDPSFTCVVQLRQFHCAIWTECIWLIADASQSETKFIISDHPVTVYNRRCGPRSMWCRGYEDPDIRFHATHTIFPLSLEKILILTNLSWVRNPYQSEIAMRPNPNPWRGAIFTFMKIQTDLPPENWAIPVGSPSGYDARREDDPCVGSGSPRSRSSPS